MAKMGCKSPAVLRVALLAALGLAANCIPAQAVRPVKSIYTALDRAKCQVLPEQSSHKQWLCQGLDGFPIILSEDALHAFLSVGTDAGERKAAKQTLAASNTVFHDSSGRSALEWRFIIRDKKPVPYALIVRYFTQDGRRRGQVLVVMRVTDSEACHVAHIDAVANPNAIMLARRIADTEAKKFDCRKEPIRAGAAGKSPM
jgi:hypothetical protein